MAFCGSILKGWLSLIVIAILNKLNTISMMSENKILILFFVCLCSCNFKNTDKVKEVTSQAENTDSLVALKIEGTPQLSYKFNVDSTGYFLKTIIIYSDKIPIQIIESDKHIEKKDFKLVDWNFDGYNDISVLNNCGSGGCAYWIWNYSKENGRYYYNNDLSEKLGLEIDTVSKFIIFHYRAGANEEYWDSLEYKNNKLSFVKGLYEQRWTDTSGNDWVKHIYTKMIDNKIITKVDSSIKFKLQ